MVAKTLLKEEEELATAECSYLIKIRNGSHFIAECNASDDREQYEVYKMFTVYIRHVACRWNVMMQCLHALWVLEDDR
ncbi:hypothetical protein BsWGS_03496 [Bradybaena similaris]